MEDESADEEDATGQVPSEPYFLFVGRLENIKGLHTLLPFFRRWGKARLLVAGEGRSEARLRRLAGGSDRIRFLGVVNADRRRRLYRNAVASIVPSLSFELFPLVILEAFREAAPVVARDIGSLPEIIEESGGGLVYEGEDGLSEALERLVDDAALRDRLGRRGRAHFEKRWSVEPHLARYFEIIGEIAARRGGPTP